MIRESLPDILDDWDEMSKKFSSSGKIFVDVSWNGSFHDAYETTTVSDVRMAKTDNFLAYSSLQELHSALEKINEANLTASCEAFDLSRLSDLHRG